jgi:uncharacterized SAM-dependent methyltransferase
MNEEFTSEKFQPYAYYNEDMDYIEVYFKDEDCMSQPFSSEIELYKSFENNKIVGVKILGIKKLITSPIDASWDEIATTNTEQFLEEMIKSVPSGDFQSFVFYNRDGNMIEAYLTNDSYYAKRLVNGIDLHLNQDTDEIVGFSVHGIKSLLESKVKK